MTLSIVLSLMRFIIVLIYWLFFLRVYDGLVLGAQDGLALPIVVGSILGGILLAALLSVPRKLALRRWPSPFDAPALDFMLSPLLWICLGLVHWQFALTALLLSLCFGLFARWPLIGDVGSVAHLVTLGVLIQVAALAIAALGANLLLEAQISSAGLHFGVFFGLWSALVALRYGLRRAARQEHGPLEPF